ncbi:hypothetical protein [Salidesulfovibrio onnuriiensis]|uniref:hypothetical protein n=1 Tax=Salidesulfovibrio onnuriiensis TaxID=2583823 RepID=UPI0011C73E35|nr:hypothetical protein [Salidesulfovibrio onnuriiensis]
MVNLDVTGQQVHFVSQNAATTTCSASTAWTPTATPWTRKSSCPAATPPNWSPTFGGDEDIRFFLIPDGGDMNIDFSQELHFIPHGDTWELSWAR